MCIPIETKIQHHFCEALLEHFQLLPSPPCAVCVLFSIMDSGVRLNSKFGSITNFLG